MIPSITIQVINEQLYKTYVLALNFVWNQPQLVVNLGRSIRDTAGEMGMGKSTMDKWARQLRGERNGISPQATPMTPDQLRIRELEKRLWCGPIELSVMSSKSSMNRQADDHQPNWTFTSPKWIVCSLRIDVGQQT
jgi:transposase